VRFTFSKHQERWQNPGFKMSYGGREVAHISWGNGVGDRWYWVVYGDRFETPIPNMNSLWPGGDGTYRTADEAKAACKQYAVDQLALKKSV